MSINSYPVEVQSDFLEKITRSPPIQALAELIWNGLDADATSVSVYFEENELGAMSRVVVRDNGTGIERSSAPGLFGSLGGSWKRTGTVTKEGRFLHGQDGRGRFKAFALGSVAEWDVTYLNAGELRNYLIKMSAARLKQVDVSDEQAVPDKPRGVALTIHDCHKDFRSLKSDGGIQELTEIFALYLSDYAHVGVLVDGTKLDPSRIIASKGSVNLPDIVDGDQTHPARLEIIEWNSATNRALYLCNERGLPLHELDRRFHVGSFQFSAYLKSTYVSRLQKEGTLELAEMNPLVTAIAGQAQTAIKDYFRDRAAQEARTIVEGWKVENIYPYQGEASSRVEQAERQVFDIVATNVAHFLPDFSQTAAKNKALHLRLLRQAIEKSPEDLQLILGEVLKLPKRKQEELAELLRDVSLSAIISASKIVADRLKFLTGLDALLFDPEHKKRLKERSQLHRIIAQNCWLFGEEYNLSVDDKSLTEVLRQHRALLGDETAIDEPVKHISKERGIIDLMLSRAIKRHKVDELNHLVVELKAPKVRIDKKEIVQIEEYAISVMKDDRFKGVKATWTFWVISDDYGDYASHRMNSYPSKDGRIYDAENVRIWVKTWAQVLNDNRARMQFFQERLEYEADKGSSLAHLQQHYARFLQGVVVDGSPDGEPADPAAADLHGAAVQPVAS